jgi:hypothetical protein
MGNEEITVPRVEELEKTVRELTRKLASLQESVDAIRALGEDFWRKEAAAFLVSTSVKAWKFQAEESESFSENLFQPEFKDGRPKRWVSAAGAVAATIAISRSAPLLFSAEISNFVSPALAETFRLVVDGTPLPWSTRAVKGVWTAHISRRPSEPTLTFSLGIQRDLIPAGKDVSFAIRSLSIEPA